MKNKKTNSTTSPMKHLKKYDSVSQMVADMPNAPDFARAFEKRLEERRIVKQLLAIAGPAGHVAGRHCTENELHAKQDF